MMLSLIKNNWLIIIIIINFFGFFLTALEFELRALHLLGKCLTTWATPLALLLLIFKRFFELRSHYGAHANLELMILLTLLPSSYWDYRCEAPHRSLFIHVIVMDNCTTAFRDSLWLNIRNILIVPINKSACLYNTRVIWIDHWRNLNIWISLKDIFAKNIEGD
jgi:hypothetical protein